MDLHPNAMYMKICAMLASLPFIEQLCGYTLFDGDSVKYIIQSIKMISQSFARNISAGGVAQW